jgi:hypothetical protein
MDTVERVKNICLTPNTEWPVIAAEATPAATLVTDYVAPLAAVGAVAGLIGGSVVGHSLPFIGTYRVPVIAGIGLAVFTFAMAIVGVLILALIINALAPSFGGEKNSAQALKVAVYSYTPAWVAGVLRVLPLLGVLGVFAALYGLYLLYLGLPKLMKCPQDRAIGYTAVVVVCAIVMSLAVAGVGGMIVGAGMVGAGVLTSMTHPAGTAPALEFDKNTPMGKLQEIGKQLEESSKKMDAAEKAGDSGAQIAAAMEGLGTLFGGGRRVESMDIDKLKAFVPETFAGLPKISSDFQKSGVAGLMVSKAEATYGDGAQKSVTVEISDTGGVSGLVAFAGWVGIQGEKDDDSESERTEKVGGRLIHQKISKIGGTNEFEIVLGDRFIVSAKGRGVDLAVLKGAMSTLDLGQLEGMKEFGLRN